MTGGCEGRRRAQGRRRGAKEPQPALQGLRGGLGFRVWGLGFRVWGLGFRVWGLGFRVWGLGFRVWGLGIRVWGLGLKIPTPGNPAAPLSRYRFRDTVVWEFSPGSSYRTLI